MKIGAVPELGIGKWRRLLPEPRPAAGPPLGHLILQASGSRVGFIGFDDLEYRAEF